MPAERHYRMYPYYYNNNNNNNNTPHFTTFSATTPYVFEEREDAVADQRSAHNALERQRREHLNLKYQELANALPSLQSVRRPSKAMIVTKSLEFVEQSRFNEDKYTSEILALRQKNEFLRQQAAQLALSYPNLTPGMILSRIHHQQQQQQQQQ